MMKLPFENPTPEEIVLLENILIQSPNGERVHREALAWLGEKMIDCIERGEVLTCYTEATEHALHPDGYTWADSSGPLIPLQRQPNQVATPVEGVA